MSPRSKRLSSKIIPSNSIAAFHMNALYSDVSDLVVITTDFNLSQCIADRLIGKYIMNTVRGQIGYSGYTKRDRFVSVLPTGMGHFPTCLYAEILFKYYDVASIIKLDTCLSLRKNIKLNDNVIVTKASFKKDLAHALEMPESSDCISDLLHKFESTTNWHTSHNHVTCLNFIQEIELYKDFTTLDIETAGLYAVAQTLQRSAIALLKVSDAVEDGRSTYLNSSQRSFQPDLLDALFNVI